MSRVVVLGLDGVPASLLRRLAAEGVMPAMGRLLAEGDLAAMDTVHPPLSSVSWTTFFTGVNPGVHRILGFFEAQVDAYQLWFQNHGDVKAPGLWEIAQAAGRRTLCVNLPGTYPATPLNGIMISGFVAEDFDKSVYPRLLKPLLEKLGYQLDVACETAREQPAAFWESLRRSLAARARVIDTFLRHEPFDLLIGVLTETDRVHHFYFDALEEPHHPQRAAAYEFYRTVDAVVGRWVEALRPDDELLILADHGFCRVQQEVNVNHWLQAHGFLTMRDPSPGASLGGIDPQRTRAFAIDPGRIFLNVRGRQPEGCVPPAEAAALAEEIAARIAELEVRVPWQAAPFRPITRVLRRGEIYHGPWAHLGADLVLHSADGFDLKGRFNAMQVQQSSAFTGMHTFGDAMLFVRGRRWPHALTPRIIDLAPTILRLLGLTPPAHLEGRVLLPD